MTAKWAKVAMLFVAILVMSACAKKKDFSGEYAGKATALLEGNYSNAPEIANDKSPDAVAVIKQNGNNVTAEVTNSSILKNCKLTGVINPNGRVYVSGGTCDVKVSGQARSVYFSEGNILMDEAGVTVTIDLLGIVSSERFKFKFEGKKK